MPEYSKFVRVTEELDPGYPLQLIGISVEYLDS